MHPAVLVGDKGRGVLVVVVEGIGDLICGVVVVVVVSNVVIIIVIEILLCKNITCVAHIN